MPSTICSLPQGTLHIRTIKGGAEALDAFLQTEHIHPLEQQPGHTGPTSRDPGNDPDAITAPPRRKRRPATPPPQGPAHRRLPPSSPARPARSAQTDLTQFITEAGDPDRDSIPRDGPYVSLVPPSSPWNTLGTDMIGVHNPNGAATSPTFISPKRYAWLHATYSRLNQGTSFLQDL